MNKKLSFENLAGARIDAKVRCAMLAGYMCKPIKNDPLCTACIEGDREAIKDKKEREDNAK